MAQPQGPSRPVQLATMEIDHELDPGGFSRKYPATQPRSHRALPSIAAASNIITNNIQACMTTFSAASIVPAYEMLATDLNVTLHSTTYLTSLQILILGIGPLFWRPLSSKYGRRPIFLLSLIGALAFNVGCALSSTYGTMMACRVVHAFFISPAGGIGSGVVTETFFKSERAFYIGVWTLMVTLGPPAAPFFMGFVAHQTGGWRWIYWVLTIVSFSSFFLWAIR